MSASRHISGRPPDVSTLALRNISSQHDASPVRRLDLCDKRRLNRRTTMKRIVTHLLVATGLAAGACGVAQAHTDLSIGLSLGAPAPVYVQPAPAYAAPQPVYDHPGWNRGDWQHREWDRRDWNQHRWNRGDNGRGDRGGLDARGDRGWGWRG